MFVEGSAIALHVRIAAGDEGQPQCESNFGSSPHAAQFRLPSVLERSSRPMRREADVAAQMVRQIDRVQPVPAMNGKLLSQETDKPR